MDEKVPPDEPLPTRTEAEGATVDLPEGPGIIATGQVEGDRYEIMEMLGRGGMGEVWHAFDLKLRVEVALKALREDLFQSERRLELLRQEVRAAREVISPNVCRIFDLIEIDGRELVSMEYVDGATLLAVLQERGPLELKQAQDIASQFLAGLEAIHKAGLVHRDIKPENIMLTRAGRVVVMDFGLARQETEGGGSVSGTPAYMAPEHAAGHQVDARADVYSAGVVLAEMVSPDGIKSAESRSSVWKGVRSEPAQVPDSPWGPVIERAVARDREGRPNSAHTLIRELEDVTMRVEGAEDLHPYPGLASFTEEDAEYFFGREAEIEQMWRRLEGPTRVLALVGPSGAGKTSFVHAGLLATRRPNWGHIVCTPGGDPHASLRRAMISELEADAEAIREFAVGDDNSSVSAVKRWARACDHALIVVDQFEELFTQNTIDVQRRFATLLGQLAIDANVFVLVSMRDDFLFRCHQHEALRPVLSDLTMLGPPEGAALRRALVQPATKCGYRFEDDELVDEMLAEVEGERGALPMLAFAASRLWERRDSQSGLLTRQASMDIGGVSGALARHAEATIDLIGVERIPIVRELFRNLVTAEGTRAVRKWDDLLSVFEGTKWEGVKPSPTKNADNALVGAGFIPARAAAEVLTELINARLLTSYEIRDGDQEPTRTVEIIHESLLANWPRLVRWQTQDADAAQLRDQLRQAARTWDEHGRSGDYLWTGTAYREYALWRKRYPGGLSDVEEAFADATTAHAKRLKRRRKIAVTTAFIILIAVLAVVGASRQQAVAEANRAEASKLITLGRFVLENNRTETLAYAITSLDRSDTPEGRRLALRALWAGPPATILPEGESAYSVTFSPDGRLLVVGYDKGVLRVFPRNGGAPLTLQAFEEHQGIPLMPNFSSDGRLLVSDALFAAGEIRAWKTHGWQLERLLEPPEPRELLVTPDGFSLQHGVVGADLASVLTVVFRFDDTQELSSGSSRGHWVVRRWPLPSGPSELIGEARATEAPIPLLDPSGGSLIAGIGGELHLHRLENLGQAEPRVIGRHDSPMTYSSAALDPTGELVAACDEEGILRVWPISGDGTQPEREIRAPQPSFGGLAFSPDGSRLGLSMAGIPAAVWDLRGAAFAEPLRFGGVHSGSRAVTFSPDGRWFVTAADGSPLDRTAMWPLSDRYPRVLRMDKGHLVKDPTLTKFHPDGTTLFTVVRGEGDVQNLVSWPLQGGAGLDPTVVFRDISHYTIDRLGRFLVVGQEDTIHKIPFDGAAPTVFEGVRYSKLKLDPKGRYLTIGDDDARDGTLELFDLETGERLEFEPLGEGLVKWWAWFFDPEGRVLVTRGGVLSRWDPATRTSEVLVGEGVVQAFSLGDGQRLVIADEGTWKRWILDLEDGSRTPFPAAHRNYQDWGIDQTGTIIITGHQDGEIRVGPIYDEEPHVLFGHATGAPKIFLSRDGKWIASIGKEGALHLWPMPDLSKRPFHTLPYDEFMAKLKALTNLRAIPDPESYNGYAVTPDFTAYRGWETVPTW